MQAKKPRRSSEQSITLNDAKKLETVLHLLKFFICHGLDFKSVSSNHFKNFCGGLNPNFEIPSPEEFEQKFLPLLSEHMIQKNLEKVFYQIIFIQCTKHTVDDKVINCMLSYGVTQADSDEGCIIQCSANYVYLLSKKSEQNISTIFDDFSNESVLKLYNMYNVKTLFIFTNTDEFLNNVLVVENIRYHIVISFSVLLKRLKSECQFVVHGLEEHNIGNEFFKQLNALESKISKVTVSDATKLILDFANKDFVKDNESVQEIIDTFMILVYYTSVFLNHKYQLDILTQNQQSKIFFLLGRVFNDSKVVTHTTSYINKSDGFRVLFDEGADVDPYTFWIAAAHQYTKLSMYALQINSIPAMFRYLDVSGITSVLDKYKYDDNLSQLYTSLFLQET